MTGARIGLVRRGGTAALGVVELSWGGWAYFAPASFFTSFPGLGHRWTGAYLPYNEHLTSDLGATFLTLGGLLVVAAILDDRRVSVVVLLGAGGFNALHLAYHARHRGELIGADYGASLVSLVLGVLVPLALLFTVRRPART
ncbi:hypothetical protein GCM10023322_00790 [Rugosimonospora acidiphila]|uniref:DUF4345 domain-containing protein n=1 Tax=Rugosimonospora acidiphila TaxID=556531 RepID=A0ABP9RG22_9ACTN